MQDRYQHDSIFSKNLLDSFNIIIVLEYENWICLIGPLYCSGQVSASENISPDIAVAQGAEQCLFIINHQENFL